MAPRHPEVTLADATNAVGGVGVATRPTASGGWGPVRVADTVHLAPHGRGHVAREIRFGIGRARSGGCSTALSLISCQAAGLGWLGVTPVMSTVCRRSVDPLQTPGVTIRRCCRTSR